MALPRLNESPQYIMKVPSTGQEIKFRPFLVKEQKVLLIAQESNDPKQVLNALINSIENCTEGVDVSRLATFDADYMFAQIRSKSVGETSNLIGVCKHCEAENTININIQEITVDVDPKVKTTVQLTPSVSVKMKYPSYFDFIDSHVLDEKVTTTEILLNTIVACMDSIMTEDDNILVKDESPEEVHEFLNSLTTDQFEKITEFVQNIPKMKHIEEYKCAQCGSDNQLVLEGLNDFFS